VTASKKKSSKQRLLVAAGGSTSLLLLAQRARPARLVVELGVQTQLQAMEMASTGPEPPSRALSNALGPVS